MECVIMVEIRLTKDGTWGKQGDILDVKEDEAKMVIDCGSAEYAEQPKEVKQKLSLEDYKKLCEQAKKEGRTLTTQEYHNSEKQLSACIYASSLGVAPKGELPNNKLEIAFPKFKQINALDNVQDKHKAWLEDYAGKHYSIALQEKHMMKWQTEPKEYNPKFWRPEINLIKELGNRTRIEFDGDADKAKEDLAKTETRLRELGIGFIKSTHLGKSPYLWVEFTRDLKPSEKEAFLKWIAPEGSQVDINFASHEKVFAVLYATHWRHSYQREMPVDYFEGNKIDYDSLGITAVKGISKRVICKDGFQYDSFVKENPNMNKKDLEVFTRRGQIEVFWKEQPFFYDTSKIFYQWDKNNFKWVISDEVDFCNLIYQKLNIETINTKNKSELVEGFKQVGRQHKPKKFQKTWVQYKNNIYDVKTGEVFEATPEYFGFNPIPWKVGESEETPTIDKLFEQWVGKENVNSLYQIVAYNTSLNKFLQRIFALCGGGANGKGTFIKLLYKFLGKENCVASELKALSEDKFEPAVLYGKLLCIMGEVSHDDLRNTNMIKKIAGEDQLSYQFKGKTPFSEDCTATGMCLTNSMPATPDKTIGFYRKWYILDFPNQFSQMKEDIIAKIPEVEFENLAKKSLRILKELYENPVLYNEGDYEERAKRYEQRSNPVLKFVEEQCEETAGENVTLRDFTLSCNDYMKRRHLRMLTAKQIGKILREEGFQVGNRKIQGDISAVVILNLTIKTIETIESQTQKIHGKINWKLNSFDSNHSFNDTLDTSNNCFFCSKPNSIFLVEGHRSCGDCSTHYKQQLEQTHE